MNQTMADNTYMQENVMTDYYHTDPNLAYSTMDYTSACAQNQYGSTPSYDSFHGYMDETFSTWAAESSLESPSSLSPSDQENDPFTNLETVMHSDFVDTNAILGEDNSELNADNNQSISNECSSPESHQHELTTKLKHCKFGHTNVPVRKVHQRQAANVRERRRMKTINDAFEHLRVRVPTACEDRKMSKVDTLKMAVKYIGDLTDLLKSVGDGTLPGLGAKCNNKIMVKYAQTVELTEDYEYRFSAPYGHSLSWVDTRECAPVINNRLRAKLWIPQFATAEDIASMTTES